ncbi:hypothetical protein V5N11_017568 [Cardamine amara subsp. amara]|uniref:DUF7903 domain-containing protein n=1 Tax=Cardamine amara subsp. amara TaxID=228776 RepID=A0ABD0ZG63_CARAN
MSYIPPHKRHLKNPVEPSPVPDYLLPKPKKNLNAFKSRIAQGNAIVYSGDSISKWFLVSSNGIEDEVPPSIKFVHVSSDSVECRNGEKPLVLMKNDFQKDTNTEEKEDEDEERTRWLLVAEKIEEDLLLAYEQAKKLMEDHYHVDNGKQRLVARFGKVLFYKRQAGPVAEYSRRNLTKIFSTDVPTSYIQNIKSKAVPSHKFCIDKEKETYIVKIDHYTSPNATISCICTVYKGRWKAERNPVRHLVVDVSCIDKNLDMRLVLATKRKINALTEKEKTNIKELLDSVTIDPNGKGRLRWKLGKTVSDDEYKLFEVCHVRATIYKNRTLRLKVRETDRFNERSGTGEINKGVTLILEDVETKLQEKDIKKGCVMEMLQDALGTIWDFLQCNAYFT